MPSTLNAGDVAIIGYNAEDTNGLNRDTISFVVTAPVEAGTVIYFTDRAWNGTSFAGAGNDGTYTYTAGSALAAGSIVTITTANLGAVGINLADTGETLYVYQGSDANTPTRFLFAVDAADGNTTFNGSLTNTGLSVANNTAVAISYDNAAWGGRGYNIQTADLLDSIADSNDWVGNENAPQSTPSGSISNAPDQQLWIAASGGGHALVHLGRDGASFVGEDPAYLYQNSVDDAGTPLVAEGLYHPTDIFIDSVHQKMFVADSDGNGHNRLLQFDLAAIAANPGAAPVATILYSDTGVGTGLVGVQADINNGLIYFANDTHIYRVNYNTPGQTAQIVGYLGANNFVQDFVLDLDASGNGSIYATNSAILASFGTDTITKNFLYRISNVTPTSTTGSTTVNATQMEISPNDTAVTGVSSTNGDAQAFPKEYGNIQGLDIDPVTHTLYFTTGTWSADHDGNSGTPPVTQYGGVFSYATVNNSTGVYTTLFRQDGTNGPDGLLYYIEVDPITGKYYIADRTGGPGNNAEDQDVWVGNLSGGTPSLFATVANLNGLTPLGMHLETAPVLTSVFAVTPTYTETPGADSPNGTPIVLSTSHNGTDVNSGAQADQLAGAQVRISGNFQSGTEHADVLTINGATSGTIELGTNDITFSYNAATGVMTLSGVQTLDNYEAVLALVRFRTDGDNPTNYGNATTRTIGYSLYDGLLYSDEQNVTVSVVGVNDAPVIVAPPVLAALDEDGTSAIGNALAGGVSDVDADPASQALRVTLSVTQGALTFAATTGLSFSVGDGTGDVTMTFTGTANAINAALSGLSYAPILDYNGTDTLTFTVNDQGLNGTGGAQSDSETITLIINAVADIAGDSASGDEDSAIAILVQANDSFENSGHAITAVGAAAHGTVVINDNGTAGNSADDYLVYTPGADYNGTDSFTYTVTSGGVTETAMVSVTVNAVADIAADSFTVTEDTGSTALNVLINDSFEDPARAITAVGTASHGSVSINDNGTAGDASDDYLVYTPDLDYNGGDSFSYTVTSGGVTETATVTVTVNAVADIAADNVSVNEDSGVNSLDLLGNDSFDSAGRAITAVGAASNGTVAINDNGTAGDLTDDFVTYTPNAEYSGADSFTYTVTSGGVTETATVNVTVNAVNDAPVFTAGGGQPSYAEGDLPVVIAPSVTASDIDSSNYAGGSLTVALTAGLTAGDNLSIIVSSTAGSGIEIDSGGNVFYNGVQIGTISAVSETSVTFDFDSDADDTAVAALAQAFAFYSDSDDPTNTSRVVTFTLIDGGGNANGGADTASFTRTITVVPADDAADAVNDSDTVAENATVDIDVLANDTDPDGPAVSIVTVEGTALTNTGDQVVLASGAIVTLNADGTLNYDPNDRFNTLVAPSTATATGAVNSSATDSFSYTIGGGDSATVTVTVTGVTSAEDRLEGDSGNNSINGTAASELFMLNAGGTDTVNGGGGSDGLYFGGALDASDTVNGGGGADDQLGLQGNYNYTFSTTNLIDIDTLVLVSGSDTRFGDTAGNLYDYVLTTVDENVASGAKLTVNGAALGAGEDLTFDGSAETDGFFFIYGGLGQDILTGGSGSDAFYFGAGKFSASDQVDGLSGADDQLGLRGDYSAGITFLADTMANIDTVVLLSAMEARFGPIGGAFSYDLTFHDDNVGNGETLVVSANGLQANESATIDGSAETNGKFRFVGGLGDDIFLGGAGADQFFGRGGADTLTGGDGNDIFYYRALTESDASNTDLITDFTAGDKIDLSYLDAKTNANGNNAFNFIGSAEFSHAAGELRATLDAGVWTVQGDVNGDGDADFVLTLNTTGGHALAAGDFVL